MTSGEPPPRGDEDGAEQLFPLLYDQLHGLAKRYFDGERDDHTLQPTALIHEVYLKLRKQGDPRWNDRSHFVGVAAMAMRSVLVDYARSRGSTKRGGGLSKLPIEEALALFEERAYDLVLLDDAIEQLAKEEPDAARIVTLRFFGGLTAEEAAEVMGLSVATVNRRWKSARAWLAVELAPDGEIEQGDGDRKG